MHHIGMSTAPALYKNLGYKPLEDFEMVGLVTEVPMTIVARKDFPPATFQDLVTYVKANAGKVTLANAGIGAASHLCGLLFQSAAGRQAPGGPVPGHRPRADRPRRRPGRLHVRPDDQHHAARSPRAR